MLMQLSPLFRRDYRAVMAEVRQKKKKGRSFLQKAKRFGRQGQRGKGTEIEQDQYDYLVRVMERWREGWDVEEERVMFVANVLAGLDGEEVRVSGNQLGSRVVELLLPSASPALVANLSSLISADLRPACLHPFLSHVLEKLLILQTFQPVGPKQEWPEGSEEWVHKVCRFVVNNCEEFSSDVYASHLVRTCCQCMAGRRLLEAGPGAGKEAGRTEGYSGLVVWRWEGGGAEQCGEVLHLLATRICSLESDSLYNEFTVRTVSQFLAVAPAGPAQQVVVQLLDSVLGVDQASMEDTATVRLAEAAVQAGMQEPQLAARLTSQLLDGR